MRERADIKVEASPLIKAASLGTHVHKMLQHPLRHEIVIRLTEGPASTHQLADDLGESEERIREQLKVLRKDGPEGPPLVELLEVRSGRRGGKKFVYAAAIFSLGAEEWEELGPLEQATSSATILKKIWGEVAASFRAALFYRHPMHHLTRYALDLDEEGAAEINALLIAAKDGIEAVNRRSAARRAASGERPQRFVTALHSFPAAQGTTE